jgi:hypothetical protein
MVGYAQKLPRIKNVKVREVNRTTPFINSNSILAIDTIPYDSISLKKAIFRIENEMEDYITSETEINLISQKEIRNSILSKSALEARIVEGDKFDPKLLSASINELQKHKNNYSRLDDTRVQYKTQRKNYLGQSNFYKRLELGTLMELNNSFTDFSYFMIHTQLGYYLNKKNLLGAGIILPIEKSFYYPQLKIFNLIRIRNNFFIHNEIQKPISSFKTSESWTEKQGIKIYSGVGTEISIIHRFSLRSSILGMWNNLTLPNSGYPSFYFQIGLIYKHPNLK